MARSKSKIKGERRGARQHQKRHGMRVRGRSILTLNQMPSVAKKRK
jgi:hypothetical protein